MKTIIKKSYGCLALGVSAIVGISAFSLMDVQASVISQNSEKTHNEEANKQKRKSQIEEVNEIKQLENKSVPELSRIFDEYVIEGKSTDDIVRIIKERGKENKTSYSILTITDSNTGKIQKIQIMVPAALELTEKQKEYLKSKGVPIKQTPEESESSGIELVSLVNPAETGAGRPHNGELDIIKRGEFEKKYGGTSYTRYAAWE